MSLPHGPVSVGRAVGELATYAGVSVYAFTMTTPELGVAVTIIGGVIGVIVWLVRLEGRINTQGEILSRVEANLKQLANAHQRGGAR